MTTSQDGRGLTVDVLLQDPQAKVEEPRHVRQSGGGLARKDFGPAPVKTTIPWQSVSDLGDCAHHVRLTETL